MTADTKKSQPDRDKTDESLRTERINADQALRQSRNDAELRADRIVEEARAQADAVLDTARDRADQKVEASTVVTRARGDEDAALEAERTAADAARREERATQARVLAALLPLEREKTDRSLLTERARSDDALAHRDDFLGMVSHDLRNLLSGIVLNAMLLGEDARASDDVRRSTTDRIRRYSARMNRLVGDLVDVVSIDAGKLAIERRRGDLAPLLVEAVEIFAHRASEKEITLESTTVEGALWAAFDRERMLQVMANLITNAINYTPRGGRITVHGERGADGLKVTVRDNGSGIPDNMLGAVFERFWQLSTGGGAASAQRGLGLGLYISRSIIDGHLGQIWVESKLGEGSAFHFTLPATTAI